jgi:hypothetical protein
MMMQSTFEILAALSKEGLTVSLVGDKLKVEPRKLVTEEVKEIVARHKLKIIESLHLAAVTLPAAEVNPWGWLRPISYRQPCYAGRDQGPSCFSCKSYDGRGSSWPGLCRYPESIGRAALEIDWNVVDPVHGCGCYEPDVKRIAIRDKEPDFCFNNSPFEESPGCPSCDDQVVAAPMPCKKKISNVALSWLRDHRQALKAAGWSMRELYRRNRSRGVAWARVWDKEGMTAILRGEVIEVAFQDGWKVVQQTARPVSRG